MGMAEKVDEPQMHGDRRYRVLREGSWKLVESSTGQTFLYDMANDPHEHRELSAAQPADLARLRQELETTRTTLGLPPLDAPLDAQAVPAIDDATRESLKALGYAE
jgi:arylsulfatase A-like enzyme